MNLELTEFTNPPIESTKRSNAAPWPRVRFLAKLEYKNIHARLWPFDTLALLLFLLILFSCVMCPRGFSQGNPVRSVWPEVIATNGAISGPYRLVPMQSAPGAIGLSPVSTQPAGPVIPPANAAMFSIAAEPFAADPDFQEVRPFIEITPTGAIGKSGRHKVEFLANINATASAPLVLHMPSGETISTKIIGLCYITDSQSVLFAELKDCQGELLQSNEVRYPDAFSGASASVVYDYTQDSISQDIVIHRQLPTLAQCNITADPAKPLDMTWPKERN